MLIELYELKEDLRREVGKELTPQERKLALKDEHAKRKPIGCGFIIHPAYGCENRCLYCYIQDMKLDFRIKVSNLSGKQLSFALLSNKFFVPKHTFLAFGSITDPFHPQVIEKTIDFMTNLSSLENPIQFSTKHYISREIASCLGDIDKHMSGLVTITSLTTSSKLEPRAPSVEDRIETIENLRKHIKPCVFLRPIIPGINTNDLEDIINLAKKLGIPVVFGEFRVTKKILNRLKEEFDVSLLLQRINKVREHKQTRVFMKDVIKNAIEIAHRVSVRYFLRASCHNAWAHEIANPSLEFLSNGCVKCENSCKNKLPKVKDQEIIEFLEFLGYKGCNVEIHDYYIYIDCFIPPWAKTWIETVCKRKILFQNTKQSFKLRGGI